MQSTLSAAVPDYVGADLTDRYSVHCRDIDVCGLTPAGTSLRALFWHWRWDRAPEPLNVGVVAEELRGTRVAMLDGPQALARQGRALRACERQSVAVGKTPDVRPELTRPFAGFICSSLELFAGLRGEGISVSPQYLVSGVSEVYPGHIWTILTSGRPLPQKSTEAGRLARKTILEALGVTGLPALPTHDQNDAAVAAIVSAAADGRLTGVSAASIGDPLTADSDGILREGSMVIPRVSAVAARRIAEALAELQIAAPSAPRAIAPTPAPHTGAEKLLAHFVAKAVEGDPHVCTYSWAYRTLFNTSFTKFSVLYARKAIELACQTRPRELPGFGLVRLDTFLVSKKDGIPSDGYWAATRHHREEWERVLGCAKILD